MSWKIYEGIKIEGIETFQDAQDFIESLRKPITEILRKRIAKQVKQMACLIYDLHESFNIDQFADKDKERIPLLTATVKLIIEDYEEETEYSIGMLSVDGTILALPFFLSNRECLEFIIEHPQVSAFGYWDNIDPDENVSEKEWKLRKRLWTKAFKEETIPSHVMMMTVLANTRHMVPSDKHMRGLPSLQEREEACVNHIAMMRASPDYGPEKGITALLRAANALKDSVRKEVEGKLKKNLSLKDLEKELPKKENNNESEGVSETSSENGVDS